jgi:hypothetical protein
MMLGWDKDILPNKLDFTVRSSEHQLPSELDRHHYSYDPWSKIRDPDVHQGCCTGLRSDQRGTHEQETGTRFAITLGF